VQSRFGGAEGDADGSRDLWQRHPQVVVQDDHRPVTRRQACERLVEHDAIGERTGRVGHGGFVSRLELDLEDAPASTPGEIECRVD